MLLVRSLPAIVALTLACASACLAAESPALPADAPPSPPGTPKDAAAFISRTAACNHWAGEEAYSPQRAKEIRQAVRRLKCSRLEADERRLREKYRGAPAVLEAIEEAKSLS